ncbi:MAG: Hpt domain-containing protein [Myxococcota bacterium]|jgi:HPt (histidine-containing phosphotransfer) domain-containing protein|nr:Hpt domain-containing protein [Myxococcota bacterium]
MSEETAKRLTSALVAQYAEQMRVEPQDYIRLLGTFLSRNKERLAELHIALGSRDIETAQRVAHSIKGTALTLRLPQIAELAVGLEDSLRRGELEELAHDIAKIETELELIAADAADCH